MKNATYPQARTSLSPMLVIYVGENEEECGVVADRLTLSRSPLRLLWAPRAGDAVTFDGPKDVVVVVGSDIPPYERLRLMTWLALEPTISVVAIGNVTTRSLGAPVCTISNFGPRILIEVARPVPPPTLAFAA
jgi:hypothetical protein